MSFSDGAERSTEDVQPDGPDLNWSGAFPSHTGTEASALTVSPSTVT